MPSASTDARWPEAILLTASLWLFVLLIFLPVIIERHSGDLHSIVLDSWTVMISMGFALLIFAIFRQTIE